MELKPSLVAMLAMVTWTCQGSIYQWSAEVKTLISEETGSHPRAYLWVPPHCERVRDVIVGQHNMEEQPILEHSAMRQTLADLGMAAVWVTPSQSGRFAATYQRPLSRAIDNVRFYTQALDAMALETIRQADLINASPAAP